MRWDVRMTVSCYINPRVYQRNKRAKGLITFQAMDEKLFKVNVDLITFKHKLWSSSSSSSSSNNNNNSNNNSGNTDV
jgi:hypothetical protein